MKSDALWLFQSLLFSKRGVLLGSPVHQPGLAGGIKSPARDLVSGTHRSTAEFCAPRGKKERALVVSGVRGDQPRPEIPLLGILLNYTNYLKINFWTGIVAHICSSSIWEGGTGEPKVQDQPR